MSERYAVGILDYLSQPHKSADCSVASCCRAAKPVERS